MRIDIHSHFLPPDWEDWSAKFGGSRWPRLQHHDPCSATMLLGDRFFRKVTDQCWSPERRIADMDETGIEIQVLSPVPIMLCYWAEAEACRAFARLQNEYCAEIVARHPKRFRGMATVPLQDTTLAIAELRHAVEGLSLTAVEIGTCPGGRDFDHPDLFPFFEACRDLGVAVFVHPTDPVIGKERMGDYYLPNIVGNPMETALAISRFILGGVMARLPDLRICFAHGGGAFALVLGRLTHGWKTREEARVHTDLSPRDYARMLYYDSLIHSPEGLRFLIDAVGGDKIVIGTDYPWGLGEQDPVGFLKKCDLGPGLEADIGGRNALRFLGSAPTG